MKKNVRVRLTILFGMLSATAVGQDLNLRTGLWEAATSMETQGNLYPEVTDAQKAEMDRAMAGMTPEQRAQMAQMRAKMEKALKDSNKEQGNQPSKKWCLTKEGLKEMSQQMRPETFGIQEYEKSCKPTIIKSTSSVREIRFDCADSEKKGSMTLLVAVANPETFTVSMETAMSVASPSGPQRPFKGKLKTTARWLAVSCGDVKP